jgi:hypothetical protein
MTDRDVWTGVEKAKRRFKSAETKATKKYSTAKKKAFGFYGSTDVEQAARHNVLQRAQAVLNAETSQARVVLIDTLEKLRSQAGDWADLVPVVLI